MISSIHSSISAWIIHPSSIHPSSIHKAEGSAGTDLSDVHVSGLWRYLENPMQTPGERGTQTQNQTHNLLAEVSLCYQWKCVFDPTWGNICPSRLYSQSEYFRHWRYVIPPAATRAESEQNLNGTGGSRQNPGAVVVVTRVQLYLSRWVWGRRRHSYSLVVWSSWRCSPYSCSTGSLMLKNKGFYSGSGLDPNCSQTWRFCCCSNTNRPSMQGRCYFYWNNNMDSLF